MISVAYGLLTLAAIFFAYEIYLRFIKPNLSPKELAMITQEEQAIVDGVRALLAKVSGADQAIADATARATAAEAALAAEQTDHAELMSALQATLGAAAPTA